MKNISVMLDDLGLSKALHQALEPEGYNIVDMELTPRVADYDFTDTELIVINPAMAAPGIASGLIDTLKSRSATSGIPILICTQDGNDKALLAALGAGASDFILLPASERVLMQKVRSYLKP